MWTSRIPVDRVAATSRNDESTTQAARIVVDTRVWNEKMPTGSLHLELPEKVDSERSFRVRLRRKNETKYEQITRVRPHSNSIDLQLTRDQEKLFQTGSSAEPFQLQLLDDQSSNVIYQAKFYRFKSDKSKTFQEIKGQQTRSRLQPPAAAAAASSSGQSIKPSLVHSSTRIDTSLSRVPLQQQHHHHHHTSNRQQTDQPFQNLIDINAVFERGHNRLERSLLSESDSIELSSIKPSFVPEWANG